MYSNKESSKFLIV